MSGDLNIHQEDWDSVEFQNALKLVIKCEIVSLLERLSETGEETVLLMANTTDLRVGHLASSKGERFVSREEVGEIKNRFLYFCTVSDNEDGQSQGGARKLGTTTGPTGQGRVRSRPGPKIDKNPLTVIPLDQTIPAGRGRKGRTAVTKATGRVRGGRGRAKAAGPPIQHYPTPAPGSGGRFSESDIQKNEQLAMNVGANSTKRLLTSPDQYSSQPSDKRTKLDMKTVPASSHHQQISVSQQSSVTAKSVNVNASKASSLPQQISLSDPENGFHDLENKPTSGMKVDDKSVKSLQHHLGNSEFEKFLKQYHDEIAEGDDYDEEGEYMLEDGEIRTDQQVGPSPNPRLHPQVQQNVKVPGHAQSKQQQQNVHVHPQMKQNTIQTPNKQAGIVKSQSPAPASLMSVSQGMKRKVDEKQETVQQKEQDIESSRKSVERDSVKDGISHTQCETEIKEEADPHDLQYSQSADKPTVCEQSEKKTNDIRKQSASQPDKVGSQVTQPSRGQEQILEVGMPGSQVGEGDHYDSDEEFDVAEFIARTRAKRAQEQSELEADVNDKLGQLSAKLSWVVEYPKGDELKPGKPVATGGTAVKPGVGNLVTSGSANFVGSSVANLASTRPTSSPSGGLGKLQTSMLDNSQASAMAQLGSYPQGAEFPEEYDEEEDDYEEGELDDEEIEALKKYHEARQQNLLQGNSGDGRPGLGGKDYPEDMPENIRQLLQQFPDDEEEEEYENEDYHGEMEDGEHYSEYNSGMAVHGHRMDIGNTHRGLGFGKKMGSVNTSYGHSADSEGEQMPEQLMKFFSSTDNYEIMGDKAKCLVCSRFIRTAGIPAHNKFHFEEDAEEEEEADREGHEMDDDEMLLPGMEGHEMGDMEGHEMGEDEMGEHDMDGHEMGGLGMGGHELGGHGMGGHDMGEYEMGGHGMGGHDMGEHEMDEHEMGEDEMAEEYDEIDQEPQMLNEINLLEQIEKIEELRESEKKTTFRCDICNKEMANMASLSRHKKIHTTVESTHACSICNKTFKFPNYLKKHMLIHNKKKPDSQEVMSPASATGTVMSSRIA